MTDLFYLYSLVSNGMHRPFYVGATCNPKQREKAHRKKFGNHFTLIVLETREDARDIARLETELITWYLERKVPLLNIAIRSAYHGRGLTQRLERYIKRAQNPTFRHGSRRYAPSYQEDAARRAANCVKRRENKERSQRQKEYGAVCSAKLAEMIADGSADRIAREILAANKTRT